VGLGTDSAASNDVMRVLAEARDAAGASLSAHDRVALATVEGARAIGLDDGTGTLGPGAPADLAAFSISDVAEADRDPAHYLVSCCAVEPAALTVVGGVVRARHGRATARDEAVDERVRALGARIRAWAAAAGWRGASAHS
jgi:5-methylthioadenosine/S-adenosylhomocysteine deaminase